MEDAADRNPISHRTNIQQQRRSWRLRPAFVLAAAASACVAFVGTMLWHTPKHVVTATLQTPKDERPLRREPSQFVQRGIKLRPSVPPALYTQLGGDFQSVINAAFITDRQTTDEDLALIGNLTHLRYLCFTSTVVSDAGVQHLTDLHELESLTLDGTRITDRGLESLSGLMRLKSLALNDTQITDAGLKYLGALTELEHLNLSSTAVTDAGLQFLLPLKKLKSLDLIDTRVTEAAVKEFERALPGAHVVPFGAWSRTPGLLD
jgi:Leucine-rich repeat (LRR) protein